MLASVGLWVASELIAFFMRYIIKWAWDKAMGKGHFVKMFGESETLALVKSIYNFFKDAFQIGIIDPCLKFMMENIQQTQATKKLS